jgi:(S)-ureidoglycine aminohydrolase
MLPGMRKCAAVVHIGPAMGAGFAEYTAEFESDGELGTTELQRFVYLIEGFINVELNGKRNEVGPRGFAYIPAGLPHRIIAAKTSRGAVIEKPYEAIGSVAQPHAIVSCEDDIPAHSLDDDTDLQVKCLLPDEMSFDFAVNTMVYQPGAALTQVEMHVMEHGLIMLEGGGIYRLGDSWYAVTAGDFIWMGPWCPQWFGAIGKAPAKYLIYKDWNRHPLAGAPRT